MPTPESPSSVASRVGQRWAGGVAGTRGWPSGEDQRVRVRDDSGLIGDSPADELREAEGVLVRRAIPVLERILDPLGDEPVHRLDVLPGRVDLLRGDDESPRRAKARDEALVAGDH